MVRWGLDGWQAITETAAAETGLGFYAAALDSAATSQARHLDFTIRWHDASWIGADYKINVTG